MTEKEKPITKKDVYKIADQLAKKCIMPTIANVRESLGRGSESTLHKHLKTWKDDLLKAYCSKSTGVDSELRGVLKDTADGIREILGRK